MGDHHRSGLTAGWNTYEGRHDRSPLGGPALLVGVDYLEPVSPWKRATEVATARMRARIALDVLLAAAEVREASRRIFEIEARAEFDRLAAS